MHKKLLILCLIFVTATIPISVTHDTIAHIASYIVDTQHRPDEILVIFDIDNTIAHPYTEVGSDQWLEHLAKKRAINGTTLTQAYQELLPLYYQVQFIIDLQLVESQTPALINQLKNSGLRVMGLTARCHPIIDRTLAQLARLEVQFEHLFPQEMVIDAPQEPALYKNGVAFCGNNNKGIVLFELLKKIGYMPKKIVFIDDKAHHLERVEKVALEHGVECVCIHYTACQERVANFDPEQAQKELITLVGLPG